MLLRQQLRIMWLLFEFYLSTDIDNIIVLYFPKDDITKLIIKQAVDQLNSASITVRSLRTLMNETASKLPEYPVVSNEGLERHSVLN